MTPKQRLAVFAAVVQGKVPSSLRDLCVKEIQASKEKRSRWLAKSKPRRQAQEAADAQRSAARSQMRADVWAWNLAHTSGSGARFGLCDCGCGYAFRHVEEGDCDHWIEKGRGGPDTRENGWRLRHECHIDGKHADKPNRVEWNRRRKAYCERAGIPFIERRVRA